MMHRVLRKSYSTIIFLLLAGSSLIAEIGPPDDHTGGHHRSNVVNIRNIRGELYAYIVLLFNENPHFVNLIRENSIPLQTMQKEGFHVIEYRNYLAGVQDQGIKTLAHKMFDVYLFPEKYSESKLRALESQLEHYNVILRFASDGNPVSPKINLEYCIFGRKKLVNISHPLFEVREKIYNIQPFIYYDELSTSNSTFYFDMIYINPEEVENDYLIAKNVLQGKSVKSMFFVGSPVSDDIKYCLIKAFPAGVSIKNEIWRMFEIHELTHKILNNKYNSHDQVTGEELALLSTMHYNPYLGLSVMYSYLDYNVSNPHRSAAVNVVHHIAKETKKQNFVDNPSLIKYLPGDDIAGLAKERFSSILKTLK